MFNEKLWRFARELDEYVTELRRDRTNLAGRVYELEKAHDYGRRYLDRNGDYIRLHEHAIQLGDKTYPLNDVIRALVEHLDLAIEEVPSTPAKLRAAKVVRA